MDITLTNASIRAAIEKLGLPTLPDGQLGLLGVRGAIPVDQNRLRPVVNRHDYYDDAIVTFGVSLQAFRASVDPGRTYTVAPLNKDGAANLQNGLWRYQLGYHKGHEALVQAAAVKVTRDKDRDGKPEPGEPVEIGHFGINIHAGGLNEKVGPHSAGCQVIHGGWEGAAWLKFMSIIKANRQQFYQYWLIDAKHLY